MKNRGLINRDTALGNILLKRDILLFWKENGLPVASEKNSNVDTLEYFPKSIRQFNAWDLSRNSDAVRVQFPGVKRNANDTLNNYLSIRLEIAGLINILKSASSLKKGKLERLIDKQRRIDDLLAYVVLLERELIQIRLERSDLTSEFKKLQASNSSIIGELKSRVSQLKLEVSCLESENCNLVAALAKISPLPEV